jgi:hypothetical protein
MQELDSRQIYFQTPFTSFCVFSAMTTLAYAIAWPHMVPGLDGQHSLNLYTWGSAWLRRSCKLWKVSSGWYTTLLTMYQAYMQVKVDPLQHATLRRDVFPELEEDVQRLAGSETVDPARIPTANILLLLQRQQRPLDNSQGSTRLDTEFAPNGIRSLLAQDISSHQQGEPGQNSIGEIRLPSPEPILDQDLIANILSDPSGDAFALLF